MSYRYTQEQTVFLRDGYKSMNILELTKSFNSIYELNKSRYAIKSFLTKNKFTSGRKKGHPIGCSLLLTEDQVKYVKENYTKLSIKKLTEGLNKKFDTTFIDSQLKTFTTNHDIKSGRTGCFEKNDKPWNHGLKGYMGSNATSFKKGSVPANFKPVGSERICSKDGIILIKINEPDPYTSAKTRWKAKHIVVWEKHNGKVPKGKSIFFLDSDKNNCDIDNLKAITKAQVLYLNQHDYKELPLELKPDMFALAMLETKRFKLQKEL